MTDHYAEAERLLSAVGNTADAEDRRQCLMEAQVHANLATVPRGEFEKAAFTDTRTISWPPPDDLVERIARVMREHFYPDSGPYVPATWREQARAVLNVIGGTCGGDCDPETCPVCAGELERAMEGDRG